MLVLSRKVGQRINIGGDVFIEVLRVRGDQVRIGIEAPEHVHILRGELQGREDRELAAQKFPGKSEP